VHSEIHNIRKPSEALPSQVFQVVTKVIKEQRVGKGHNSTKGTVPSDRGLARTLMPRCLFCVSLHHNDRQWNWSMW